MYEHKDYKQNYLGCRLGLEQKPGGGFMSSSSTYMFKACLGIWQLALQEKRLLSSALPARDVMRISTQLLGHQKVLVCTYRNETRLAFHGCLQR